MIRRAQEHRRQIRLLRRNACSARRAAREARGRARRRALGAAAQARAEQRARSTASGRCIAGREARRHRARPCASCPNREDLFASHGGGYNAQKRAFDAVGEGEVIVIEARGEAGSGTLGDILALRAHARGAAGIVTDGGVRDCDAVAAVGIPVYSAGAHPAVLGRKHVPWDVDVTIACGGTTVQPGDVIVGDADGVIVIPPALAEEVVDAALAQEDEDAWIAEQVAEGHPGRRALPDERRVAGAVRGMARTMTTIDRRRDAQSKSQRAYRWIKERIARQEFTPGLPARARHASRASST